MPREEDNGQRRPSFDELTLQLEPVHLGHADIENKAPRRKCIVGRKEIGSRSVGAHLPAEHFKKKFLTAAIVVIIVHKPDDRPHRDSFIHLS